MTPEQRERRAIASANSEFGEDEPGWFKTWVAFWLIVAAGTLWAVILMVMAKVFG